MVWVLIKGGDPDIQTGVGGVQSQAKDAWSHQKLEKARKGPPSGTQEELTLRTP